MHNNKSLTDNRLRSLQTRKLRKLVADAYKNVPYYHDLMNQSKISPDQIRSVDDLQIFPLTNKTTLQQYPTKYLLNRRFHQDQLLSERSSGSTGQPFTVYFDKAYHLRRNLLFLRGLFATGYRLGQKLLLISSRPRRSIPLLRWRYLPFEMPDDQMIQALCKTKPEILYGPRVTLIRLAQAIEQSGAQVPKLSGIITTAESLSNKDRTLLSEIFQAQVYDFYGSTEMGLVGWECSHHDGYHLSVDSLLIEYLPVNYQDNHYRLVITNLDLAAMPLIRFDTGDIAVPSKNHSCKCNRQFPKLQQVEGRQIDCIKLVDGRMITPYQITCTIEKMAEVGQFKIIQNSYHQIKVIINLLFGDPLMMETKVRSIIQSIIGCEMNVEVYFDQPLEMNPIHKSRVVESHIKEAHENPVH